MERKWEAIIPPQQDMAAPARGKVHRVSSSVPLSSVSGPGSVQGSVAAARRGGAQEMQKRTDFNDFLPARQRPGLSTRAGARSNRELGSPLNSGRDGRGGKTNRDERHPSMTPAVLSEHGRGRGAELQHRTSNPIKNPITVQLLPVSSPARAQNNRITTCTFHLQQL